MNPVCIIGTLQLGEDLGLEPSNSDMGCKHPTQCLSYEAKHQHLLFIIPKGTIQSQDLE